MNLIRWTGLLTASLAVVIPAQAADNRGIERLATCQDSWLDWKERDPAQLKNFIDNFQRDFLPKDTGGFFVPKGGQTIAGLPVAQVYPESVGMGVGFSVVVDSGFDSTKRTLEQRIGKSLNKCEPPSDNMRTCELEIAQKKTIVLMAEDNPKSRKTLFGCFYLYAK